ncbi:MAG: DNA mismatch repair endonuclease MutL [Cellulosilyticaceae bacterium]
MSAIKILDSHTINKIAAGEVVERPASVVKELVENSIDAKSSSITVEIKNGGIDFVRVTDNGKGIAKDEVEIAFLRHATSKISRSEDLYEVISLGFRGEALASIASVSNVELITKQQGELTGKRVEAAGGKIISSDEIAAPEGTTFIMRHLFYNVPARKEFLKSSGTEAAKITDYMYKLALAHPEVTFKYIVNNKLVFNTPGNHDLQNCTFSIYGKETARNTIKLYYKKDGIEVVGLLGNTTQTRGNRNYEHFFINGRYIKDYTLQKAVEEAYKTLITIGKFPFVVIHLYVDPAIVDVNVHPTKMEVRFKDQSFIYNAVYEGVLSQLQKENLVPTISLEQKKAQTVAIQSETDKKQLMVETFFTPRKIDNVATAKSLLAQSPKRISDGPRFESKADKFFSVETPKEPFYTGKIVAPEIIIDQSPNKDIVPSANIAVQEAIETPTIIPLPDVVEKVSTEPQKLIDYTIIGQLFTTYWIVEYNNQSFIIDQHAAHERVMYERFLNSFTKGDVKSQILLLPETIHVTNPEAQFIEENLELLCKLGFKVENFGENSVIIREVPYLFNKPLPVTTFRDILDATDVETTKSIYSFKADTIMQLACKSAIKAHDKISEAECKMLIEELLAMENPFTCPHGRPTMVSLSKTDIEKMFKRI